LLKTLIVELENCRVMADDSKEEKLGIRNCEKGPRIRKPVPPPEEEVLLESLQGVLMA